MVEEMKASGANIILGPIENTHSNGMSFNSIFKTLMDISSFLGNKRKYNEPQGTPDIKNSYLKRTLELA